MTLVVDESMQDSEEEKPLPSLLERLVHWSDTKPEKVALTFVDDKGIATSSLTYHDLTDNAKKLSHYLLNRHVFDISYKLYLMVAY